MAINFTSMGLISRPINLDRQNLLRQAVFSSTDGVTTVQEILPANLGEFIQIFRLDLSVNTGTTNISFYSDTTEIWKGRISDGVVTHILLGNFPLICGENQAFKFLKANSSSKVYGNMTYISEGSR